FDSEKAKVIEKELLEMTHGNKVRDFFPWNLYFADVFRKNGGFDVVIANPPYLGEKGHKDIFQGIVQGNLGRFYKRRMDLFYFFFHLTLNLSTHNAQIAFITTNYYPTADGAQKLRTDFKQRAVIRTLVNFHELRIFETALGQHNMITILTKTEDENAIAQMSINMRKGIATAETLNNILSGQDEQTVYSFVTQKDLYKGSWNYIRGFTSVEHNRNPDPVLAKIATEGEILKNYCKVESGIQTGLDRITNKHLKKYPRLP
ncbi:unnamed protein product, partial [marine sediment metagenome]